MRMDVLSRRAWRAAVASAGLACALSVAPCAPAALADAGDGGSATPAAEQDVSFDEAGGSAEQGGEGGQAADEQAAVPDQADEPAAEQPGESGAATPDESGATYDAVSGQPADDDQAAAGDSGSAATDGSAQASDASATTDSDAAASSDTAAAAASQAVAPEKLLSFVYADHTQPAQGGTVRLAVALLDATLQVRSAELVLAAPDGTQLAVQSAKYDGGYVLFELSTQALDQGAYTLKTLTLTYADQAAATATVDFSLDAQQSCAIQVMPAGYVAPEYDAVASQGAATQDATDADASEAAETAAAQQATPAPAADACLWLCDTSAQQRVYAGDAIQLERAVADWLVSLGFSEFSQALAATEQAADPDADIESQAAKTFKDTPAKAWYVTEGWLDYVTGAGLMTGYSDGSNKFGPEDNITREQVLTILYRYANPSSTATTKSSDYGKTSHFSDVPAGQYYTAAVEWAYQLGITTGYTGTGRFGTGDPITRQDLATMLYRFARACGIEGGLANISGYPDSGSISSYATAAMRWANGAEIITGDKSTSPARLKPQANATRAEAAKMFTVLVRDTLDGAAPAAASWTYSSLGTSNKYVLVGSNVTATPQVSGSTKGLTYQYGWTCDNGQSWTGKAGSDASFSYYLGGSGTFTLWCQVSDSSGLSRIEYSTVYVWQSSTPSVSGDQYTTTWNVSANLGISNTSGFTFEYTWKKGADEGSATWAGSETGGSSKSIWVSSDGYWWMQVKATDPEGHSSTASIRVRALSGSSLDMYNQIRYLDSPTDWLIAVDTYSCLTGIYYRTASGWDEYAMWYCSPGTYSTPTVTGIFSIDSRGYYFDSYGVRCYYWTQFYGEYLFHSTTYYAAGGVCDSRLGMNLSHGCVRLAIDNAKWIYENIPVGTTVKVYGI